MNGFAEESMRHLKGTYTDANAQTDGLLTSGPIFWNSTLGLLLRDCLSDRPHSCERHASSRGKTKMWTVKQV